MFAGNDQILAHSRRTVGRIAQRKALPDAYQQRRIGERSRALRTLTPLVKATGGHPEQPTHRPRRPHRSMAGNKGKLHVGSFAKKPSAFFKMSRSIFTFASSRRSCSFSCCCADFSGSVVFFSYLPDAKFSTQCLSTDRWTPSSRATAESERPGCSAILTASRLNSAVKLR